MVLIILAIVGVPLWLVVGALGAGLLSRRRFAQTPGAFPAKLRLHAGEVPGVKPQWSRRPSYVLWIHDVLVVHKGLAQARTVPLPVATVTGQIIPVDPATVTHLGSDPISLTLVLDDGAVVKLVASSDFRTELAGPFPTVLASTVDTPMA